MYRIAKVSIPPIYRDTIQSPNVVHMIMFNVNYTIKFTPFLVYYANTPGNKINVHYRII